MSSNLKKDNENLANPTSIQVVQNSPVEPIRKNHSSNLHLPHLPHIEFHDLKKFSNIFNSYATKKTFATGFFNLALVATNFAQMKQLLGQPFTTINIIILVFVCLSLVLQFLVAVVLVFLAKNGEFIDEDKRNQLIRNNNWVTILVLIISVINIFINVFISV